MGTHRLIVCLATATVSFATISALLLGLLVWKVVLSDPDTAEDTLDTTNITIIREKYPGYFRTPDEQMNFEQATIRRPVTVANVSSVYRRCFTAVRCPATTTTSTTQSTTTAFSKINITNSGYPARSRRDVAVEFASRCVLDGLQQSELTFHGCCISYSESITPSQLPTAEPNQSGDVDLAQFPGFNQYFEIEKCCQADDCTGCHCAQTFYRVSAVVKRPHPNGGTRFVVEWVSVPGCCQCLNIGSG